MAMIAALGVVAFHQSAINALWLALLYGGANFFVFGFVRSRQSRRRS